ncbi:MAG TPA: carboxypeptidase-like regulatory domain-containing protein [Chthoniobacterales bacterium]|nr:carboxypeptidase-like regulatory domain-containing protein [Chthoniobacterales bacterium]
MRIIARGFIALIIGASACAAYGALPQMNVTVADSSGKTAYKGTTDSRGLFASPKMQPGNYAVQFSSNNAPKGSHYTLVVVAGTKKTSASAITAEKLAAGGVAMKVEVKANASIQGQVSAEENATRIGKNGQLMVWIPKKVGSNIPAHWAESDSAEAKEAMTSGSYSTKTIQDKQNQGISPR